MTNPNRVFCRRLVSIAGYVGLYGCDKLPFAAGGFVIDTVVRYIGSRVPINLDLVVSGSFDAL